MYDAAKRFDAAVAQNRWPVVIYLGDHDPSGLDMTRDVKDRLETMTYELGVEVERLALNYDQVLDYNPPPNPAKLSDSRANKYVALYGAESWELDALEPQVLDALISDAIESFLDMDQYDLMIEEEERGRESIREAAQAILTTGHDE